MADAFYHRFYRGIYLPRIAWVLSKGKGDQVEHVNELHRAFKEYFNVRTTADFNNHEFLCYLSKIQMIMVRERGWMIPMFNEGLNINRMTMRQWLFHCRVIDN